MSSRRGKTKRSGHPARVAAGRPPSAPKKGRPPPGAPAKRTPPPRRQKQRRQWGAAAQEWIGRRITSLLRGRPEAARRPTELIELTRADIGWAAGTAAASAVLFATVLTNHPGLGDSAEAIAGVSSLGILHAPGYPAYVIAAHLFTLLIPVGSEAFKVNLFSLVCGVLSVAGVQLLARRCGAARWAGSIGALALAATAGFWFYTGFAKHDLFSGLLFLIALHLALSWQANPSRRGLIWLAVVIAIGLGSSWPLQILLLPTVAFILFVSRRRLKLGSLVSATATGLVVLVAMYGFVMVRAGENPALNWGGATTVSRLVNLIDRADFTPHGSSAQASSARSSAGAGSASGGSQLPGGTIFGAGAIRLGPRTATSVESYGVIFAREIGVLGTCSPPAACWQA